MNYIVSGLERSGTSLMMQILEAAKFPVCYDDSRKADEHNPKGYYELFSGKIISVLKEIDLKEYNNQAIKITAYGLEMIPKGQYKIIYMTRNIKEIYKSQQKMMKSDSLKYNLKEKDMIAVLSKMNDLAIEHIKNRDDCEVLVVNYNELLNEPYYQFRRISKFLDYNVNAGLSVIDPDLWRNRYAMG